MDDTNNIGQGRAYPDPNAAYEASHGKYEDPVAKMGDQEARLPTTQFPKAPDPSPFVLGTPTAK